MALASATITYDFSDKSGVDFTNAGLTVTTNAETIIDTDANLIRVGSAKAGVNPDGTGSVSVWIPGAGSNPTTWQTSFHLSYVDSLTHTRQVETFGPFTITASANLADLVAEMPVQPEYASQFLDLISGYTDLGNVSGAVTITPTGTVILDATGPTTLTIGTGGNGDNFTVMVRSGGADITWPVSVGFDSGVPTSDVQTVTLVRVRNNWIAPAGSGGGTAVPPVNDPATQPGVITVDPTADGYTLSWIASTVASGYEGQVDGGAYVDYGSNLTETITGLAPASSHSGAIRAYNSLGERSTARTWGPASVDAVSLRTQLETIDGRLLFMPLDEDSSATAPAQVGPAAVGPAFSKEGTNAAGIFGNTSLLNTAAFSARVGNSSHLRKFASTITNKALTSNVATLTTSTAHGLTVGSLVGVRAVDATFNGTHTITSVPTSTTLTYAVTAADVASTASGGQLSYGGFDTLTEFTLVCVARTDSNTAVRLMSRSANGAPDAIDLSMGATNRARDGVTTLLTARYSVGGTIKTISGMDSDGVTWDYGVSFGVGGVTEHGLWIGNSVFGITQSALGGRINYWTFIDRYISDAERTALRTQFLAEVAP